MVSLERKKRKNNQKKYQNRAIQISTNRKFYYTKNKANILKYKKSLFRRDKNATERNKARARVRIATKMSCDPGFKKI